MPPRGYKKGFIKHPDTGEYVDPRTLHKEDTPEEKITDNIIKRRRKKKVQLPDPPEMTKEDIEKIAKEGQEWSIAFKDELGPTTKKVKKNDTDHATVIISWKDKRGRSRTTEYIMAELSVNESISEEFHGAKKETRIHLGLDGMVLEKN